MLSVSPARARRALTALSAALVVTLAAYPFGLWHAGWTAERNRRRLEPETKTAIALANDLARKVAVIDAVSQRAASRISGLGLVALVTRALPIDAAVVQLRSDTVSATLVVVGNSVDDAVDALSKEPTFAEVRASGPTTTERVEGRVIERGTIAIRFAN